MVTVFFVVFRLKFFQMTVQLKLVKLLLNIPALLLRYNLYFLLEIYCGYHMINGNFGFRL